MSNRKKSNKSFNMFFKNTIFYAKSSLDQSLIKFGTRQVLG